MTATLLFIPQGTNKWRIIDANSRQDVYHFTARKQTSVDYGRYLVELVKLTQQTDHADGTATIRREGYARAFKRSFARTYIVKGKDMYANFGAKSKFSLRHKKVKGSSQYVFGWKAQAQGLLRTIEPDGFSISSRGTHSDLPLATGKFLTSASQTHGALAILTIPRASTLWNDNQPTELLDASIFAILLVHTERLVQTVASLHIPSIAVSSRYHDEKIRIASDDAYPELMDRKLAMDILPFTRVISTPPVLLPTVSVP